MNLIVGISDSKTSNRRDDVLTTYALGSCIAVALHDAAAGVAGMLHFQLPTSTLDPQRAIDKPLMYADTGMNHLLAEMDAMGANKKRMKVHLAGGVTMLNDQGLFDIGRRNHAAIRKVLFQHGMFIDREMIGGSDPMTMQPTVATGEVSVKCNNQLVTF